METPRGSFAPLAGGGRQAGNVRGPFATNNSESSRDAALAGLGIALLPDFSARAALQEGTLLQLLPQWHTDGAFADTLYVVRPWSAQVPRAVSGFIHWLREAFADALPQENRSN